MPIVFMDEGIANFAEDAGTISGRSTLSLLQGMGRSAGLSFIVATNTLRRTDEGLRSNAYLFIAFRPADGRDAEEVRRVMRLTDAQVEYLLRMPRGEIIVYTPRTGPFLATFEPIDDLATPEEYAAALARTATYLQSKRPTLPPEAKETTRSGETAREIALNAHTEALLRCIATHGVILTTEAFKELSLHPQAGTRAKQHLLDASLIEEKRITIRRGRGGTAVALRPTRAGYERAGVKRRGTRGGDSIQHEYLVRAIAKKLIGTKIDVNVGMKAVDVLVAYNTAHHERLARYLKLALRDADLIGIEVEVASPEKGGKRNSELNAAAGVAHTVIATMTPLRKTLLGAIVVDVFDLLEAL